MRALIQRVTHASVHVNNQVAGQIEKGLLVFIGIEDADTTEDVQWLCNKIIKLRIFDDANGVMNEDVIQANGRLLIVSQFTLHALTKKGNRPSYIKAAKPEIAIPIYELFVETCFQLTGHRPATGIFGADMQITLCNNGPVTIFIDSKNKE
ncbi:MAG: D-tyrosyl-tRNA(Tyr) deacylase [Bacteroidia bacterium]|nr:D-tyrosyl-tRNA(Tyr) deacylase [Bacteroidia bacterium]HQV00375.1 D-aminoacyl-tRNA deacylase [Bacteroidia bacterium]